MRPLRFLLTVLSCVLAFFFLLLMGPWRAPAQENADSQGSAVGAYFNWRTPSSLFPPSAIIRLTDDNSTFFLARPAAFGPLLPAKSLSGQIWIGSGFGDDNIGRGTSGASAEGELGCSDVPGWNDGSYRPSPSGNKRLMAEMRNMASSYGLAATKEGVDKRGMTYDGYQDEPANTMSQPQEDDGTDDYLHHPLPASDGLKTNGESAGKSRKAAHADIQSIQESAEIAGKVVLLSRGGCGFLEKAKWVQRRGGIALIVGDDIRGGPLVTMYARGDTSNVTIPSLFTSHTTAHLLSSLIPSRGAIGDLDDASRLGVGFGDRVKSQLGKGRKATTSAKSQLGSPKASIDAVSNMQDDLPTAGGAQESEGRVSAWLKYMMGESSSWADTRPPSSGDVDWLSAAEGSGVPAYARNGKAGWPKAKPDDGFTIGVHDWRDPDVIAEQTPYVNEAITASAPSIKFKGDKGSKTPLPGGSTTPGSGEYSFDEWPSIAGASRPGRPSSGNSDEARRSGWVARFLFARGLVDSEFTRSVAKSAEASDAETDYEQGTRSQTRPNNYVSTEIPEPHEGLWVTLTPTSMSSSPFFDTLLVLVVSPLVTLTVVYALLLLRSRIRRRRWRAPKSIVERLPVRTYHTMPSNASSTATPAPSSPIGVTTPLLPPSPTAISASSPSPRIGTHHSASTHPTSTDTNRSVAASAEQIEEARAAGLAEWRRKYGGRQRECVVCLEEYVDGVSRVMSLPCGHEFHAECITPWLTTRRRTCPICKGDVVRSLTRSSRPAAAPATSSSPPTLLTLDQPSSSFSSSFPLFFNTSTSNDNINFNEHPHDNTHQNNDHDPLLHPVALNDHTNEQDSNPTSASLSYDPNSTTTTPPSRIRSLTPQRSPSQRTTDSTPHTTIFTAPHNAQPQSHPSLQTFSREDEAFEDLERGMRVDA